MRLLILTICITVSTVDLFAQINIFFTNPEAAKVVKGDFEMEDYTAPNAIIQPDAIFEDLVAQVSADSLRVYLEQLTVFENRNTGSDTLSETFGIGAARRWVHQKMGSFSDRLLMSYLQFDQLVCGVGQHRNVMAVLPGIGELRNEVVLVEAHMDSRCEERCGVTCEARGADDNGSGTVLVMELARVMSRYAFERTIVFMATTGEEQGLVGATAFAAYCDQNEVDLIAVYNNDIVGGTICGETASPPGCPGLNAIDSINVRIYSQGTVVSPHKGLARYLKLEYQENVADRMEVQSVINLMTPEDRTGRGGDHIPFRRSGYPAIRMTSANEHGNGNPATEDYHDRQHTIRDRIGEDTNGDGILDELFVDFNYLRRNTIINGNAIASTAMSPIPPQKVSLSKGDDFIVVEIEDERTAPEYRVGLRLLGSNDFDTLYTFMQKIDTIRGLPSDVYQFSAASVDENGVESLFTRERQTLFR
ncbi:MAG: M28 family peptidase, partial [Bacteroidota bacterium]